jgi:ParB family chromosome partitioning protein
MSFQGDSIYWVEVEKVVPNPFQPRHEFDEQKLRELGESIRMYGVLQPLTVTRKEVQREDGTFYSEYELIAGERRLRASKLAGVSQVPVIIRDGEQTEQEKLELAIIENLQREDLNAVDRALAFKQLAEQFKLSHVQVAQKVGRSREYVSNSIRLLALPENILEAVKAGSITEGHARTLLMLNDRPEEQQVVFEEAQLKKLSVRDVEKIARGIATEKIRKKTLINTDTELMEMEKKFTETLGTRVQIHKTDFGGRLAIDYFTVEDLETILSRIKEEEAEAAQQSASALKQLVDRTPLEMVTSVAIPEPAAPTESAEVALRTASELTPPVHRPAADQNVAAEVLAVPYFSEPGSSAPAPAPTNTEALAAPTPVDQNYYVPQSTEEQVAETTAPRFDTDTGPEEVAEQAEDTTQSIASEQVDAASAVTDQESPTAAETEKREDDSSLYSINNFTV